MRRWLDHSPFTDPGEYASALATLGPDPAQALEGVQGLLIHGGAQARYGLSPTSFSRETLPVRTRLAAILADGRPLNTAREPTGRAVGTCRDYALLLCAALRAHGAMARVRCGFAAYLPDGPWEDHWICELWDSGRWRRLDAQLDASTREDFGVAFDPANLPQDAFLTADEAWRLCRTGELGASGLGHGEARGLWFVHVNLMRDRLALRDRLTSAWDQWREMAPAPPTLDDLSLSLADRLAADPGVLAPPRPGFGFLLREYREGDAAPMAQLYFDSVRGLGHRGYTPEQITAWAPTPPDPARFHARATDGRATLVAENLDGAILAYGDLEADGHIDHLYCRPEASGTGVASHLVDELLAHAETAGMTRLYVEASELARPLLERRGFTVVRRRDFTLREVPIHNYAMEKRRD